MFWLIYYVAKEKVLVPDAGILLTNKLNSQIKVSMGLKRNLKGFQESTSERFKGMKETIRKRQS